MSARLINRRGRFMFVFLDSKGHGLPIIPTPRAWRRYTFRPPQVAKS